LPENVIDDNEWDFEGGTFLSTILLTVGYPEPTPVSQVISDAARDGLFNTFWDDRKQRMPLRAVRPSSDVPVLLSDQYSIIADSARLETETEQRITRVLIYFDRRNPVEGADNFTNYRLADGRIFTEGESPNFADGSVRELRIFSGGIRTRTNALLLNNGILSQRQFSPQYMTIDLDAKDIDISLADEVDLQSKDVINPDGSPRIVRWKVRTWTETAPGHRLRLQLELSQFQAGKRYGKIMENSAPIYSEATEEQRANGCWLADDATGLMPNGDPPFLLW
jgi:hypothetical protein